MAEFWVTGTKPPELGERHAPLWATPGSREIVGAGGSDPKLSDDGRSFLRFSAPVRPFDRDEIGSSRFEYQRRLANPFAVQCRGTRHPTSAFRDLPLSTTRDESPSHLERKGSVVR